MNVRIFALLICASAIMVLDATSANAFYWKNWPGSGTTSSGTGSTTVSNPVQTTTTPTEPTVDPGPGPGTANAPEPATLLGGLIGLGCLVMVRGRQKKAECS
jgi:hypothetical protein